MTIKNQNQTLQIESLEGQVETLKKDFDTSVEKLHKTNRYRHELEIRFKAVEILGIEKDQVLAEKEKEIGKLEKEVIQMDQDMIKKVASFSELQEELKDLQDEFTLKQEEHGQKIDELNQLVSAERIYA